MLLSLRYSWGHRSSGRGSKCPVMEGMDWNSSLQTLPVGSLVFSVVAKDLDTGSAGAVVYSIEEVRVGKSHGSVGPTAPQGHQRAASPTQPVRTLSVGVRTLSLWWPSPGSHTFCWPLLDLTWPTYLREGGACCGQDFPPHPLAQDTVWVLDEFISSHLVADWRGTVSCPRGCGPSSPEDPFASYSSC